MRPVYDLAIVGSGFAGSLLAMIARRAGRSVLLLEKGAHPRFAIGESSTPLADFKLARGTKCPNSGKFVPRAAAAFARGTLFPGRTSHAPL